MNLQRKTQLRQKPSQPLSNRELEDTDLVVDDEITFGRNLKARDFGKLVDDELSEYVKFRLWLARQRAMAAYRKKWA